jgi:hypothetical protein
MESLGGIGLLGGVPSTSAAQDEKPDQKTRFYILESFFLKNGSQIGRLHDFLSKGFLPALARYNSGPKIVLEALVAPHMPQVAMINGYRSLDQLLNVRNKLFEDDAFNKSVESWEAAEEAPYEHYSLSLLEATDYSPEIETGQQPKTPRIFELRVYHSPTWKQLRALHERFAGPEIKIFHRSGVHPVLYSSTLFGANMPNLTYLIPFENLAAREKAWGAFGADPEWVKVRQESIDKHGQISSISQISLFKATPYSPLK